MPNFSVNEYVVASPVWIENPTNEPVTWRYDSEYTTFAPGFFRNLQTNELWCLDVSIAVHFKKSLPCLVIHTTKPNPQIVLKATYTEEEKVANSAPKKVSEMSISELRTMAKKNGIKCSNKMTKADYVKQLEAL